MIYTTKSLMYIASQLRLRLTDEMIDYIVARINYGQSLSVLDLAFEISDRDRSIKFYGTGRPIIYSDICLLFDELSKQKRGRILSKSVSDCIFIGDIDY